MSDIPIYIKGADLPDLTVVWYDQTGALIDFSSGWTFSLKLGDPGSAATLTKSTGITGAATAPNVTVAWATTLDLNSLAATTYTADLTATRTSDSKQRVIRFRLTVKDAIT